jgi:3-hydroxyisobutyrate dehydrogenase-like beta-hydroxyacid dehydrogenase
MSPVVTVIAPGSMGAAVGGRLAEQGVKVLTSLTGRSPDTIERARVAGLVHADDKEIAASDFILSIVPPGDAIAVAQRLAPQLTASNRKPVFVECNAISPPTAERIAEVIAPTGSAFVDAGIIGPPPKPKGRDSPRFYASGLEAKRFAALQDYGLDVRVLDGPLMAASALKMSYGGITKGCSALGASIFLAATRGGSADALFAELQYSQPQLLDWFSKYVGSMYPKAYRWVAEMEEVSGFGGDNPPTRDMYAAIAQFYDHIARDLENSHTDVDAIKAFLAKGAKN